jgi:hypothetical protein
VSTSHVCAATDRSISIHSLFQIATENVVGDYAMPCVAL